MLADAEGAVHPERDLTVLLADMLQDPNVSADVKREAKRAVLPALEARVAVLADAEKGSYKPGETLARAFGVEQEHLFVIAEAQRRILQRSGCPTPVDAISARLWLDQVRSMGTDAGGNMNRVQARKAFLSELRRRESSNESSASYKILVPR
ncbi:MAG: hypothetical protein H3C62_15720 [Gemmatimonadaceae bacterium]|nr:hypothetical protein [Gemmatimonadaceae bacterium]